MEQSLERMETLFHSVDDFPWQPDYKLGTELLREYERRGLYKKALDLTDSLESDQKTRLLDRVYSYDSLAGKIIAFHMIWKDRYHHFIQATDNAESCAQKYLIWVSGINENKTRVLSDLRDSQDQLYLNIFNSKSYIPLKISPYYRSDYTEFLMIKLNISYRDLEKFGSTL
jgi:hypothetical protein